jgi:hypothetical protein
MIPPAATTGMRTANRVADPEQVAEHRVECGLRYRFLRAFIEVGCRARQSQRTPHRRCGTERQELSPIEDWPHGISHRHVFRGRPIGPDLQSKEASSRRNCGLVSCPALLTRDVHCFEGSPP